MKHEEKTRGHARDLRKTAFPQFRPTRKLVAVAAVVCVLAAGFGVLRGGALVRPTEASLENRTEVPRHNKLEEQYLRERAILEDYEAAAYTPASPYIVMDPYSLNPLSALVLFNVEKSCDIAVTVQGDDAAATFSYDVHADAGRAEVPVVGLYASRVNTVEFLLSYADGTSERAAADIETEPLPASMQQYTLNSANPGKMEPGVTLCISFFSGSYSTLIDSAGVVRAYITPDDMACETPLILLENGNILTSGDEYKTTPYNMLSLYEMNWLGKIKKAYSIPNAVHHGVEELGDDTFLITSNHRDMFRTGTREDVAVILDRATGAVAREYDFTEILDPERAPYHHFDPPVANMPNLDWMHMNAAVHDGENNALIVSSPTQSIVASIDMDTSAINWILGPHEGYEGSSEFLAQYLLEPLVSQNPQGQGNPQKQAPQNQEDEPQGQEDELGDLGASPEPAPQGNSFEWAWCQHAPTLLPDQDGDSDTVDLLLFDNGQNRSFTEEGSVPAEDNYSRAVQYRIHQEDKTVEQIWEYGKEYGPAEYASFLGSALYLPQTENRLVCFGGQLRVDGTPVDDVVSGVFGGTVTRSRIVEVGADGAVCFDVSVREAPGFTSAATYQALRLPLFVPDAYQERLGGPQAPEVGECYYVPRTDEVRPPNFFFGKLEAEFRDIHRDGDRLVVDGTLRYDGESRLLGRAYLIFRDTSGGQHLYAANSSIYGRFLASVDLSELPPGKYAIDIVGAVLEGNDALNGKQLRGQFRTEYAVTVEES